jgi:GNAT superfamily N-acetyltransferase
MSGEIVYTLEPGLTSEDFAKVLRSSGLAERRPVDDRVRLERMLRGADVILTARVDGMIIGISRALTDGAYCTYLSDLAVDRDFQGRGIGRKLIALTHEKAGSQTSLVLLAAPTAESYYPHVGLQAHGSCWIIPRRS